VKVQYEVINLNVETKCVKIFCPKSGNKGRSVCVRHVGVGGGGGELVTSRVTLR